MSELSILNCLEYFNPLAKVVLAITKLIIMGDFFVLEKFIKFFKLLPDPEIKTAVLILL